MDSGIEASSEAIKNCFESVSLYDMLPTRIYHRARDDACFGLKQFFSAPPTGFGRRFQKQFSNLRFLPPDYGGYAGRLADKQTFQVYLRSVGMNTAL